MNITTFSLRKQKGISLLELAIVLVIIGLMIVIAVAVVPRLSDRFRLDATSDITITDVRKAIITFAAENSRLPCPDTTATPNGLEGSGAVAGCAIGDVVGNVPYRALGFSDPILDSAHLPVRYAVYRNQNGAVDPDSSVQADLAVLANRFVPVLPGDEATIEFPVTAGPTLTPDPDNTEDPDLISEGLNPVRKTPNNQNDLDFCLAIRNAHSAAASTSYVHTLDLNGAAPALNAAFVLASGGVEDADGDASDQAFDQTNEGTAGVDFESPARRRNDSTTAADVYDDVIYAMPFHLLESKLSCAAVTMSVNAMANISNAAAHMVVQTEDLVTLAFQATENDDLAVTLAELALALAIFDEVVIIADGVMAGLNTACPPTATDAAAIAPIVAAGVAGLVNAVLAGVSLSDAIALQTLNDDVLADALANALVTNDVAQRMCVDAVNADQRGGQLNAPPTPASPPNR